MRWFKKLRLGAGTIKIHTENNLTIKVHKYTLHTYDHIRKHRVYDIDGFELKKGMNIIDMGAHQGFFSVYAAGKGAKVYAFEPDKDSYQILEWNVRKNKLGSLIECFNAAVSDRDGTIELFVLLDRGGIPRIGRMSPSVRIC